MIFDGADLRHANLIGAIGNGREIKTINIDEWIIVFTEDTMAVGCKQFSINEWKNFDDEKISSLDSNALDWWKKWKDFVFLAINLSFGE